MLGRLKHITYILLAAIILPLLAGCSEDGFERTVGNGDAATVTFQARLDTDIKSRAISDGNTVDKLLVAVYEGETSPVETYRTECVLSDALTEGVELRLLSGHSYKVLFWAFDEDNTAYTISDRGVITADYAGYLNGGFAKMEQLDAFCAVSSVTVSGNKAENITLTRPFAQLNFADNATQPLRGTHESEITFDNVAISFNPFTGKSVGEEVEKTFTFTDFTDETLDSDGATYYYIATNYLFVPASGTVSATCRLKQAGNGTIITEHVLPSIAIAANKRTNVLGAIVQQPEDVWDGINLTEPAVDSQNRYIIDKASDLAWLAQNGNNLQPNRVFVVTKDLNMSDHPLAPVQLPQGSTVEGGGHTLRNIVVTDGGLFGNVSDFVLSNLTVDKITTTGATGHVGALVNTLRGNGSFASVSVKKAGVSTANGAAGGIVGYVVRKSENDRDEALTLSFKDCHISGTSVSGSASEGMFVGLLSGYNNGETVSFDADCSASAVTIADYKSPYVEGNEGKWLAANDYSKYDGWLGDETYCRGTVNYGGVRFIPCWDGVKKVTPLTDTDGTKLIYSAFDLAALQGGSHSAVTFKENVDLGGDGANKNLFTPISNIAKLDGENHSLYNLNIYRESWVNGFVTGTSGDTEHKNLQFVNSSVRAKMNGTELQVYVATLCPYVEHKYTVSNVTVTNGYVLGLNKSGGLIGFVTSNGAASLNCTACEVESTTIENIESATTDRFGNQYVYADFYPQGEVGGLIGAIMNDVTISNCHVLNCDINCYGQDMKKTTIIGMSGGWKVPGRHVNGFIGDIRTVNGDVITIKNCKNENNRFGKREQDTQYDDCNLVGRCYYINIGSKLMNKGVFDTQGTLIVDDKTYKPSENNGNLKI